MTEPAKRKRVVSRAPSKNGCQTCRQRRVKCDQTRPQCLNCIKRGLPCKGAILLDRHNASRRKLQPAKAAVLQTALLPGKRPSHIEAMALDFYINCELPQLTQSAPSPALKYLPIMAAQICMLEAVVMQAIVAVGDAWRFYGESNFIFTSTLTVLRPRQQPTACLQTYGRAIELINEHIDDIVAGRKDTAALFAACWLVICCENLRGRTAVAHQHLVNLKQISAGQSARQYTEKHSQLQDITESLALIEVNDYAYAEETASITGGDHALSEAYTSLLALDEDVSSLLADLVVHGQNLLAIEDQISLDSLERHCLAACLGIAGLTPSSRLLHRFCVLLKRLQSHDNPMQSGHDDIWLVVALRLQHFTTFFSLALLDSTYEFEFEEASLSALGLMEEYLRTHSISKTDQPILSEERCILRALYLIATKSSLSSTRTSAIELLQSTNRREGTFTSAQLGTISYMLDAVISADHSTFEAFDEVVSDVRHDSKRGHQVACARVVRSANRLPHIRLGHYTCKSEGNTVVWTLNRSTTHVLSGYITG